MKKYLLFSVISFLTNYLFAQLEINTLGSPVTIDFSGFSGSGFQPGGGSGTLNSNYWGATGFTDGNINFGETGISGDFASGITTGGIINGGVYSFDNGTNQMLWVQPVAGDYTPGSFKLKLVNNTPDVIGQFLINYSVFALNDQDRANSFKCSYSMDDITYIPIPEFDFASTEVANFILEQADLSHTISGFSIAPGDNFYLSWTGNDISGAGSRDEFGIDNISLTADVAGTIPEYSFAVPAITINEGELSGSFEIGLSESDDCILNFGYGALSTATPGFDYGLGVFSVEFVEGGPTSQIIDFALVDDLIAEGTELGIIEITGITGTCVAGVFPTLDITIEDNEIITPPIVSFTTIGATESEAIGSITGTIELTETADCEIQMYLDGVTTMTEGLDYIFDLPASFIFTDGGSTSLSFDIPIINDLINEPDEMLLMNLSVISGTCALGVIADFEINIIDDDVILVPSVEIASVTMEDADGVATSAGEYVALNGVVYGINLWDGGLQFTLIDATGGINVFSFDNTFGYTATEGDSVTVLGTIAQFNGLTEIEPDTIIYQSSGNALKFPADVSELNETTESDLVTIYNCVIFNEALWLGDGSSFNFPLVKDFDTITMRIDNNTEMASMSYDEVFPPVAGGGLQYVAITGIGTQFDASVPYLDGYQIMPRYLTDLFLTYESISEIDPSQIKIYPNPTTDKLIFDSKENIQSVEIINHLGESIDLISINNFQKTIDVKNLPAGFYHLKIKTQSGIYSSNFIKQ